MTKDTSIPQLIATLPFVTALPDYMHQPTARLIADLSALREYKPDEVIIRQGEIGGALGYVLLSGCVTVERAGQVPLKLSPPALLGEMYQLNPQSERTATVVAAAPSRLLSFAWHELHERMRAIFPGEDQHLVLESLERLAQQRLDALGIARMPLLQALPEAIRLKLYLMMIWLGRPKLLEEGEVLFEQGTLCGNNGFLLVRGVLAFAGTGSSGEGPPAAPAVVGVMPEFSPTRCWRRTAKATERVELLVFHWIDLLKRLEPRISPPDFQQLLGTLREFDECETL